MTSQAFSEGLAGMFLQAFTLKNGSPKPKISLSLSLTSFNTKLRALHNLLQTINNPTLVTLTPKLSTNLKRTGSTVQLKELADHSNGE